MRLKIKKKFFDAIKEGLKNIDFRDAHITFVCEETKEELKREVRDIRIIFYNDLPEKLKLSNLFDDSKIIQFELK